MHQNMHQNFQPDARALAASWQSCNTTGIFVAASRDVTGRNVCRTPISRLATGTSSKPSTPPATVDVVTQVMKVGQYPAPSVVLPKDLERNLGEEAAQFYRRALVSRNNGFGLAAATYFRRVVEDKTNELIEIAAEVAESHQLDEATVAAIRRAGDSTVYTRFEDKLQYASTVFPGYASGRQL
jgi:hypothetical protein